MGDRVRESGFRREHHFIFETPTRPTWPEVERPSVVVGRMNTVRVVFNWLFPLRGHRVGVNLGSSRATLLVLVLLSARRLTFNSTDRHHVPPELGCRLIMI